MPTVEKTKSMTPATKGTWLTWLWLRSSGIKRMQIGTALYIGGASLVLPFRVRGISEAFSTVTHIQEIRGEQYFLVAGSVLLILFAVTSEALFGERHRYMPATFFMVLICGGLLGNFRAAPLLDFQWRQYASGLEAWRSAAKAGTSRPGLSVPINPSGWNIQMPSMFRSVLVTGFPDHVLLTMDSENAGTPSMPPALVHSSDPVYVDLPSILDVNTTYRIRAVVVARDKATASLFVHGSSSGQPTESLPATIDAGGAQLVVEFRSVQPELCIHIRRTTGGPVSFRSITITPISSKYAVN